jgi:hypothetical protein
MSLRNLLPIGRAFIPAGDNSGRYRPAEAGVMPVFSGPLGVKVRPAVVVGLEPFAESPVTPASDPIGSDPTRPGSSTGMTAEVAAVAVPDFEAEARGRRSPGADLASGFPGFAAASPSPAPNLFAKPSGQAPAPASMAAESGTEPGVGLEKERRSQQAKTQQAKTQQEKISVERSLSRPPPAPVAKVTGAGDREGKRHWRLPVWVEQVLGSLVRPGNRRRGTRPVQTEMSFERVKVARNDLMTADVEVVSVGSGASGRPARLSAACRARLLRLWWGQGSERWKRLGNVFRKS